MTRVEGTDEKDGCGKVFKVLIVRIGFDHELKRCADNVHASSERCYDRTNAFELLHGCREGRWRFWRRIESLHGVIDSEWKNGESN